MLLVVALKERASNTRAEYSQVLGTTGGLGASNLINSIFVLHPKYFDVFLEREKRKFSKLLDIVYPGRVDSYSRMEVHLPSSQTRACILLNYVSRAELPWYPSASVGCMSCAEIRAGDVIQCRTAVVAMF